MTPTATIIPRMGRKKNQVSETTYSGRLAVRIRQIREAKGLDVPTVAKRMKAVGYRVSPPAVYSWENGTHIPPLDALPYLAKALKVDLHAILPKE